MKKYFVYALLDLRKPGKYQYDNYHFNFEPFYIGISFRIERIKEHINRNDNKLKYGIINKLKLLNFDISQIYNIFEINLQKQTAIDIEIKLIKLIGRRDLGYGPLSNFTDGGDGMQNVTEETRKKKSEWMKLHNPFRGKHHTEETKKKISKSIGDKHKGILNGNYGNKWNLEKKKLASIYQKESHKHLIGDNNPAKRLDVRMKIRESKIGKNNPNANKWKIIDNFNVEYIIEGGIQRKIKALFNLEYSNFKKIDDHMENNLGWKIFNLGKLKSIDITV